MRDYRFRRLARYLIAPHRKSVWPFGLLVEQAPIPGSPRRSIQDRGHHGYLNRLPPHILGLAFRVALIPRQRLFGYGCGAGLNSGAGLRDPLCPLVGGPLPPGEAFFLAP